MYSKHINTIVFLFVPNKSSNNIFIIYFSYLWPFVHCFYIKNHALFYHFLSKFQEILEMYQIKVQRLQKIWLISYRINRLFICSIVGRNILFNERIIINLCLPIVCLFIFYIGRSILFNERINISLSLSVIFVYLFYCRKKYSLQRENIFKLELANCLFICCL